MSRLYFTSPPPAYARRNGENNLVESTKIESHIVASKKVFRKVKKEKKLKNEKSIKQLYLPTKKVFDEAEQLEKSCLTEEHEQQHHHLGGYLSDDGSQNSKKRVREASPSVESNIKATPVAGNKPLRIRFVFKKPKEAEVVAVPQVPLEDGVCSTSVTDRPIEMSSSLESDETAVSTESKNKKKHRTSKESRYSSLFDEPVVPSISLEEDDGWLLGAKRQENVSSTKSNMSEEDVVMRSGESCCFPRSQFLSEVGVFSLPYTVLF